MCVNPLKMINPVNGEEITVSCGKCILCRRKRCREWALKLFHESQYYNKMCMLTLTFRPKFLLRPKVKELVKYKTHKKNGITTKTKIKYKTMINPSYILDVRKTGWLVTLFIKKLRKELSKYNINFSYFAVGEHGSQNTHRSHWHILFYGIDKDTLNSVSIGQSKKNKEIYFSPVIDKLWSYENMKIGQHTISDVTTATIKYVANYTMKKMYKNQSEKYPNCMRFSSHNKVGIKWARRYHKNLRKEYLEDNDGAKYTIPKTYYKEMRRYENLISNNEMTQTAIIIEQNKDEILNKLKKAGLTSDEEVRKKAERLEYKYKYADRDTM